MSRPVTCTGCIMVVEDDADIRGVLRECLEHLGCSVVIAVDGVHGLECLDTCPPPCLVLLDLNMPRLDGEGFLRRVRDDVRLCELPIVSMTAEPHRRRPDMTEAHLHKPFALPDLERIVRRLCRSAALHR
jgi:CheY-like chemotaxis protein